MRRAEVKLNDAPLELAVDVAETAQERSRGLLGRRACPVDEGFYFAPAYLVHTIGMRFPLDLVFCDRYGRVVSVRKHVPPGRLIFCRRGRGVLELAAGAVEELLIAEGDRISFSFI